MSDLQFRPRFRFRTPLTPDAIKERVQQRVRDLNPAGIRLGGTGHHLILQFPIAHQLAWTPQMDIDMELEQRPDGPPVTLVRCLIGPAPSIWMLFLGGYIGVVLLALFGITLGISQKMVGTTPWGLWAALPTPFMALFLWIMAQEGKRRSKDDMLDLKHFIDASLGCDCFALAEPG